MVLAAGQAMFTQFNENAFLVRYVMVSASWIMMAAVMLRSYFFSRTTAYTGILAGAAGITAVILEHISVIYVLFVLAISYTLPLLCS